MAANEGNRLPTLQEIREMRMHADAEHQRMMDHVKGLQTTMNDRISVLRALLMVGGDAASTMETAMKIRAETETAALCAAPGAPVFANYSPLVLTIDDVLADLTAPFPGVGSLSFAQLASAPGNRRKADSDDSMPLAMEPELVPIEVVTKIPGHSIATARWVAEYRAGRPVIAEGQPDASSPPQPFGGAPVHVWCETKRGLVFEIEDASWLPPGTFVAFKGVNENIEDIGVVIYTWCVNDYFI